MGRSASPAPSAGGASDGNPQQAKRGVFQQAFDMLKYKRPADAFDKSGPQFTAVSPVNSQSTADPMGTREEARASGGAHLLA